PVTLGRDPGNPIRLDDLSVSSRHAVLREHGGTWYLSDLGSTNGTFKHGHRLAPQQEIPLAEGDLLQFGQIAVLYSSRPLAPAAPAYGATA
ncbi:MAG TPA: FHA domain-containing protein, partial [Polyangiaceae bacterium]|nr:FHA domain-containing protein [Polyangiaceae bacterium]